MDQYDLFGNKIEGDGQTAKKKAEKPVKESVVKKEVKTQIQITPKPKEEVVDDKPEETVRQQDKVDEKKLEKVYYTITEVSKMFEVNASLLRFWEKEFKQLGRIKKNKKGDRYYNKSNIRHLNVIYYLLKERKMTIEGARDMIKNKRKSTIAQYDIVENLHQIKSFLVDLKTAVQADNK